MDLRRVKRIVSVSRRTDITAFYSPWFFARVDAGFCEWVNPFNSRRQRVSLAVEDVAGFVFWTRYAEPMLPRVRELDRRGYRYYFHVTINGYGREFEPRNPVIDRAISAFRSLSDAISPERTYWRYDPLILSDRTNTDFHCRNFERIARHLEGYTGRCYFSFLDQYGKTRRNLVRLERSGGPQVYEPDSAERRNLTRTMRDIAAASHIKMYACCEDAVAGGGIEKAHCVDAEPFGGNACGVKPAPTREQCGCVQSVDIGAYDTCRFGCVYCYATNRYKAAVKRALMHDPAGPVLCRRPTHEDDI